MLMCLDRKRRVLTNTRVSVSEFQFSSKRGERINVKY